MALSDELVSAFIKVTNDQTEIKQESTVYGTIVEHDGTKYVKLDGSELLTPIASTADADAGERVTVLIKNHTATVTGNASSPAARKASVDKVSDEITRVEILVADKVSTKYLEAEMAVIDELFAETAKIGDLEVATARIEELEAENVTITGTLTAVEASIENLETTKLSADFADITNAEIDKLKATDADIYKLTATHADLIKANVDHLDAIDADIKNLDAIYLSADYAEIVAAVILDLDTTNGRIDNLDANVAEIDTLIFGSASGNTIQTSFANAVVAMLGDAQIKSAMIESLSASKITAGDVITNNVRVMSEDGKLLISDETIQISDSTRVRVQIGKDASDDYSINIWDAEGNLMFSEGGITDSAIKEAIIRNDMVSDTANISAHKLNIDSLFEEINGSSNTIKATKVYFDDEKQTLDVAFTELTTDVSDTKDTVSSQGTAISVIQGQITNKIWQQDIDNAVGSIDEIEGRVTTMETQYSLLEQEIDGISATVASNTTKLDTVLGNVTEMTNRVSQLEVDLDGFRTTVSTTYATKEYVDEIEVGARNLLLNSSFTTSFDKWTNSGASIVSVDNVVCARIVGATNTAQRVRQDILSKIDTNDLTQTYVFSADIRLEDYQAGTAEPYVKLYFDGSYDKNGTSTWMGATRVGGNPDLSQHSGKGWVRVTYIVKFDHVPIEMGAYIFARDFTGTLYFKNLKLEKGNKATDWTPAPEDVATVERLTAAETKIEQNDEAIELTANSLKNDYYDKEATDSMFRQTSDSITLTVKEEIDNLNIGSVNHVRNSDDLLFENYYFTGIFVATHDGAGNVTVTCGASADVDGDGNVTMRSASTTTDDNDGNVTTT